jgi:hypothetical protein
MTLTTRQRHIVNPYPEKFLDPNNLDDNSVPVKGGANGFDYDYNSERNKWVLEGIQDSFINYGTFPYLGQALAFYGPINAENNIITLADLMAYAAQYPQNATVTRNIVFIRDLENDEVPFGLLPLGTFDSLDMLRKIATFILDEGQVDKFYSLSCPELQTPENAPLYKILAEKKYNTLDGETRELYKPMLYSALINIPYIRNDKRVTQIRKTFGNNIVQTRIKSQGETQTQTEIYLEKQKQGLDFNEWSNNVGPSSPRKLSYYNPTNRKLYYCVRTNNRNPKTYDTAALELDATQETNVQNIKREALLSLLEFSNRYSPSDELLEERLSLVTFEGRYGDPFRPAVPSGYGVWLISAAVPLGVINSFPENETIPDTTDLNFPIKIEPSPLQIARNLISNLNPTQRISYPIKSLEENIDNTVTVLQFYDDELYNQGVSQDVMVKLSVDREILKIQQFMSSVYEMALSVGDPIEANENIEVRLDKEFQIEYFTIEGNSYFQNLGRDINTLLKPKQNLEVKIIADDQGEPQIETQNRSEWKSYENLFADFSSTTLNYIINSKEIGKISRDLGSDANIPWTEFFTRYTYPNPNENSFNPNKIGEDRKNQKPITLDPKNRKGSLSGTGKLHEDHVMFKNRAELERVKKQRARTQKELYFLARNSVASCDTGLARVLQSGLKAFELYDRKARPKDWVTLAVNTVRNDIIDLLVATNRLDSSDASDARSTIDSGMGYVRDPDKVRREVEKYVNDQIGGCLEALGDAVFDFVIDPEGKPKPAKKYWKNALKPPSKLKIGKSPTRNFLSPWGKKLKQLTIKYIEQLMLSVLRDLISAALGCGPTLPSEKASKQIGGPNTLFGVIRINEVAEEAEINLLELAKQLSMVNTFVSLDDNGNKIKTTSTPTLEQMKQLNTDVSDFLTKEECVALLDGNINRLLLASITEMINEGSYSYTGEGTIIQSLQTDSQYMAQFQNSLNRDDVVYATLGLNEDLILKYFSEIGKKVLDTDDLLTDLDPKEAFCAKYSVQSDGLLDVGISQAQLNKQIDNEVERKVEKIKDWCDLTFEGITISNDISQFFADFPVAAAYNNLLAGISAVSNAVQQALLEAMMAEQQATRSPIPENLDFTQTEFYQFCEDTYGDRILDPQVRMSGPSVPMWYVGDPSLGRISFIAAGDKVVWFQQDEEEIRAIFINPLSKRNSPDEIEQVHPYSLKGVSRPDGSQGLYGGEEFNITTGAITSLNNLRSSITSQIVENEELKTQTSGLNEFSLLIQNTTPEESYIHRQLGTFWVADLGVQRLRSVSKLLGTPCFVVENIQCSSPRSKNISEAAFFGIQSRVINFLLNIGAMFRILPGYKTPDVLNALSYYLMEKIMKELKDKNILNVYLEAMGEIEKNYGAGPINEEGLVLEILPDLSQGDKLASLIRQIMETYLIRFASGNVYENIGKNIFNPEDTWTTEGQLGRRPLLTDYNSLVNTMRTGTYSFPGGPGGEAVDVELQDVVPLAADDNLPALQIQTPQLWQHKDALYYIPVPLIIAMQLIYYDRVVDINGKWPQFRFNTGLRTARADDALLSAVNETAITIFSNPYDGYPVVIEGERYYSREEIEARIEKLQNIRDRIFELELLFGPLVSREDGYENRAYFNEEDGGGEYITKSIDQFRDFFNPIYTRVSREYLRRYPTAAERISLYRQMLNYAYTAEYPEVFDVGGQVSEIWIRQRAWYERARMLGYASSNIADPAADSLLAQWHEDEAGSYNALDLDQRTELAKLRGLVMECNVWKNADGSPAQDSYLHWAGGLRGLGSILSSGLAAWDIFEDLDDDVDFWSGENWYGIKSLGALAGGPIWVIGFVVEAIINLVFGGDWFDDWGLIDYFDNWDQYLDPDEEDSLMYFRNPDSGIDLSSTTQYSVDWQGSLILTAQKLPDHKGSANSLGTLDKAAIASLYYELAWMSQKYKQAIDPDNPLNEISQLAEYIGFEDTRALAAGFPVYLGMKHLELAFTTNDAGAGEQASIKAFITLQDLEAYESELSVHPVLANRNAWASKINTVNNLLNEMKEDVGRAEALLLESDPDRWDTRFDVVRAKIYGDREPTSLAQTTFHYAGDWRGISGAQDVQTFIEETAYQDVLSEAQASANFDDYAAEVLDEFTGDIDDEMIDSSEGIEVPEVANIGRSINQKCRQIVELVRELHLIYNNITNSTSPQILAGLDYNQILFFDAAPKPNRFGMDEWIPAFEQDLEKVQNAIRWRSQ